MEELSQLLPLVEAQGQAFTNFAKRLDGLETRLNRPGVFALLPSPEAVLPHSDPERKAALLDYWRRGEGGIAPGIKAAIVAGGSDPAGGYFVEPDQAGRMISRIFEISPVRSVANTQQTISTDALEGINDLNEPGTGGWVAEQAGRPETLAPDVGKYRIPLFEQFALPIATQKILDDGGFDIEAWLLNKLARKFGRDEGTAFVLGSGIASPRGVLTYPTATLDDSARPWGTLQYLPTGAAGAFAATNPGDVLWDLSLSIKADYLVRARWMMRRSTLAVVSKLKDGQGNYLLSNGNVAGAAPMTLLGYPITLAEDMPAIAANSLSIAFGDFEAGYAIVDHAKGVSVLRDPYTSKGFTKFYAIRRVGGAVVDFDAIKVLKFATS